MTTLNPETIAALTPQATAVRCNRYASRDLGRTIAEALAGFEAAVEKAHGGDPTGAVYRVTRYDGATIEVGQHGHPNGSNPGTFGVSVIDSRGTVCWAAAVRRDAGGDTVCHGHATEKAQTAKTAENGGLLLALTMAQLTELYR